MTFIIKNRTLPGSPYVAEYECPTHGRFEKLVSRDASGDPPPIEHCTVQVVSGIVSRGLDDCELPSPLVISCPKIAFWTRAVTAINPPGATRHDEPDPRALDTRDLAEGKVTKAEWRKKQLEITKARRHAKRLKAGKVQKRIQVDSAGVK